MSGKAGRLRAVGASSVIALVVASLVFGLTTLVVRPTRSPKVELTAGTAFSITSTVTALPGCTGSTAKLWPGGTRCLTYTAHNPLKVPITVTSMNISGATGTTQCAGSNLDTSHSSFDGDLVVDPGSTNSVNESLRLLPSAGDDCQGVTFTLTYAGIATYTEVYKTSTALTSDHNPTSLTAQTVTYTATITATATASQDPIPSGPTGNVAFMDGTNVISGCGVQPVAPTTGTATCMVTYGSVAGSPHHVTAVYSNTDGNFYGSTAPGINQVVLSSPGITTAKSGNLTITSGQAIDISTGGSQSGNVTVNSGGELDILGGSVGGNVTVNGGGALYISGGKVSGNITASGATFFTVCGGTFSGNISVSSSPSTTFVLVGDNGDDGSPACAGNSVSGNISATSSGGGVEIGGNTIGGGITLTGTTATGTGTENATPEIEGNKVSGGLSCSGNTLGPIDDKYPNTVKGKATGQCSARGF